MSDTEDENDIFEINDFTIVTPMEELCSSVENLIQRWSLYNRRCIYKDTKNKLIITREVATIKFGENQLKVMLIGPEEIKEETERKDLDSDSDDMLKVDLDNASTLISVAEEIGKINDNFNIIGGYKLEFGFIEALVILPFNESKDMIALESQAHTILGALKTALHTNRCEVPVLIRLKEMDLNMNQGYATDGNVSYFFTSTSLRNLNKKNYNLSGLLTLFKEHIRIRQLPEHDDIRISARFHHFFPVSFDSYEPIPSINSMNRFPFGPGKTLPIDSFTIVADWKSFREDVLIESDNHTDFDINHATSLSIIANPIEEYYLKGLLGKAANFYIPSADNSFDSLTPKAALGKLVVEQSEPNALDRLAAYDSTSVRIGGEDSSSEVRPGIWGPLSPIFVDCLVSSVFDETQSISNLQAEIDKFAASAIKNVNNSGDFNANQNLKLNEIFNSEKRKIEKISQNFKSSPPESILWKFATIMTNISSYQSVNKKAVPQLWLCFVKRLREKYENNEDIEANNEAGEIDLSNCFLSQKLQLLQCCINARRKRHALFENVNEINPDEFYDASNTFSDNESNNTTLCYTQGRLKPFGEKTLLGDKTKLLYIPITQDRSPMTEDMLEQHTNYLCELSEENRVLAQLDPLKSDMMAFKAANPNCVLGDFLIWHSPKDIDEVTGELSERMKVPNNTWLQCWESTRPVAVINQTRLFNDSKLAEEVFELLENCTLREMKNWLRPVIFVNAYYRILSEIKNPAIFDENLLREAETMVTTLQNATQLDEIKKYNEVLIWMKNTEILLNIKLHLLFLFKMTLEKIHPPLPEQSVICSTINILANNSFNYCFNNEEDPDSLTDQLTIKPQEPIGRAIANICGYDKVLLEKMKNPERKQFIMLWNVARPSESKIKLPQRMYANLEKEFNQICFSLGEDCNFINSNQ